MDTFLFALILASGAIVPGTGELAPADGLGLEATPAVVSEIRLPATAGPRAGADVPTSSGAGTSGRAVAMVGTAAAAGAVLAARRRRRADAPFIVLVHGDGGSASDFDPLLAQMGVASNRVVSFDYRSVVEGDSSTSASRHADAADAAVELDRLIRTLASQHGSVYSIHHSKGGAVGVEMIAGLDAGVRPPIDGYVGAALLDPAVGSGGLGWLQRVGRSVDQIPDNGAFDPWRCDALGCRDIRDHLGERSGVEVIAVRNPDALITNFTDRPEGLRTYDLVDDGAPSALALWWNPVAAAKRIVEAHGSVLRHPAVGSCVAAEMATTGSCTWTGNHDRLPFPLGRGVGRFLSRWPWLGAW